MTFCLRKQTFQNAFEQIDYKTAFQQVALKILFWHQIGLEKGALKIFIALEIFDREQVVRKRS